MRMYGGISTESLFINCFQVKWEFRNAVCVCVSVCVCMWGGGGGGREETAAYLCHILG